MKKSPLHLFSSSASDSINNDQGFKVSTEKMLTTGSKTEDKSVFRRELDFLLGEGSAVSLTGIGLFHCHGEELESDMCHLAILPSMSHQIRAKKREMLAMEIEKKAFKDFPHIVFIGMRKSFLKCLTN